MNIVLTALLYFITGFAMLVGFCLVGALLMQPVTRRYILGEMQQLFVATTVGLTVIITLFSVCFTGFQTINTGFLLIFLLLYLQLRKIPPRPEKQPLLQLRVKQLAPLLLVYLLFFSWEATMLFKGGTFNYVLPHDDFIYYSNISDSLLMGAKENFYVEGNFTDSDYRFMSPYHYFEIWLNTFVVWATRLNNISCFMLVGFPVLYFTGWLGVLAIAEQVQGKLRTAHLVLSILLLFTGGLFLPFFYNIPFLELTNVFAPFPLETTVKKYATFYPFIVGGLMLLLKGRITEGLLVIMALSFVSITAFPGILGGLSLFVLMAAVFKIADKKTIVQTILHLLLITIFIIAIYFVFNQSKLGMGITSKQEMTSISRITEWKFMRTFINIIGGASIQTAIVFLPLIILALLRFRSSKAANLKPLFIPALVILCIIASSLLAWAFMWQMPNSAGFYASSINYLNVMFIVFFVYCGIKFTGAFRQLTGYGFLIFLMMKLALSFSDNIELRRERIGLYSDNYINEVNTLAKGRSINPVGGFILAPSSYRNSFDKNTFFRRRGPYLKFLEPYKFATNINILDAPVSQDSIERHRELSMINLSVFNQFVLDQKRGSDFRNNAKSQIDFIDSFKLNYIIADKHTKLSSFIASRVDTFVTDPISGERFYILGKPDTLPAISSSAERINKVHE